MIEALCRWIPPFSFALLGFPLSLQDQSERSVSAVLLAVAYALWLASALVAGQGVERLLAPVFVLLIGRLVLFVLPDRLGEADVIFMSGMASIFPFWQLMLALALGCVAGLAAFAWGSRGGRSDYLFCSVPFLPSLYWGGLTVILGGFRL